MISPALYVQQREEELAAIKSDKEKLARMRETIARKLDSTEKQKMELDEERERLRTQIHSIEKGIPEPNAELSHHSSILSF